MYILVIIAIIIALLFIIPLFSRKAYTVEREIIINKPPTEVYEYIRHLKNQREYSKWVMMDLNAKSTYTGTDGAVGFIAAWDSNQKNVGKGEQEIKGLKTNVQMDLEIRFEKPFKGVASGYIATDVVSSSTTKVRWGFASSMPYPMNIMLLVMNMEKMLGNDISEGLANLKKVLERN